MNISEVKEVLQELDLGHKMKQVSGYKGENIMFLCPYHGEVNNPSAGILVTPTGEAYGQCFGCGEKFTIEKLYADGKDITFNQAQDELAERFGMEVRIPNIEGLIMEGRRARKTGGKRPKFSLDHTYIAPFKSGKETHEYFYERGFTEQTMKECRIGWDKKRKRITIPIFHRDGSILGVIGRAIISNEKSREYKKMYGTEPKYFIYERFPVEQALFGCHEFPKGEKSAILVEGSLDRLKMRQMGYMNTLSMLTSHITRNGQQVDILKSLGVKNVYFFHDNDKAGEEGKVSTYHQLKKEFMCFDVEYPDGKKDPDELEMDDVEDMLQFAKLYIPPKREKKERKRLK